MKILQEVHKNLAIVGICPSPTQASDTKIKLIFLVFATGFASSALYICPDANTFLEYSFSMYITTAVAMITFIYAIVTFNMAKLFDTIFGCQKLLEGSKLNHIRTKLNL